MMTQTGYTSRDAAIDWAIRLADPRFDDWDGFTLWLESDPAHAHAYAAVVDAADAAEPLLVPPAAIAAPARPGWRRPALAGALAACLVGVVSWGLIGHGDGGYQIGTAPGTTRTVTLDTATIALNGDTLLRLDRNDPHGATLVRGEALFSVRHDAAHPFTLHVGDAVVQDVGTRFDVTQDAGTVRVGVAEGRVLVDPASEAVPLAAGDTLTRSADSDDARIDHGPAREIGGWTQQRLSYRDAPLALIAADLARGTGIAIRIAPDAAAQRFTGVIAYGGDRDRLFAELGPLLDVTAKHDHQGWILSRKAATRL